jgi:hypothetical protein
LSSNKFAECDPKRLDQEQGRAAGPGHLRPRLAQRRVRHPHLYGRGDGRSVTLGSALKAWLGLSALSAVLCVEHRAVLRSPIRRRAEWVQRTEAVAVSLN